MLIRVLPDDLRQSALIFDRMATDLYQYRSVLRSNLSQMEMNWTGCLRAEEMALQFRRILEGLEQQIVELNQMGYALAHQADLWDLTDQNWTAFYRSHGSDHRSLQG